MAENRESPENLVFAICHEVSNLLAAARMQTHILDPDLGGEEFSKTTDTLSQLSSRMASLVAQIRLLLTPETGPAPHVDPLEVLDGLQRGIEDSCEAQVRLNLKSAVELPHVRIEPACLHHVLLTAIYDALEIMDAGAVVRISASTTGNHVVFSVEADGPDSDRDTTALRGGVLSQSVADAILRERGGSINAMRVGKTNRIEFCIPAEG